MTFMGSYSVTLILTLSLTLTLDVYNMGPVNFINSWFQIRASNLIILPSCFQYVDTALI